MALRQWAWMLSEKDWNRMTGRDAVDRRFVHVYPRQQEGQHILIGCECTCGPRIEVDPEWNAGIVIHQRIQ